NDLTGRLQRVVDVRILFVTELDAEGQTRGAATHLPQIHARGGVDLFKPRHGVAVDRRDHRVEDAAVVRERIIDVVRTVGDQLLRNAANNIVATKLVVLRLRGAHSGVDVEVPNPSLGPDQQVIR